MVLLPVGVFAIAITGAFSNSDKPLTPALFALGALLSAEVVWLGIRAYHRRQEKT
jgi:hypothetical protein